MYARFVNSLKSNFTQTDVSAWQKYEIILISEQVVLTVTEENQVADKSTCSFPIYQIPHIPWFSGWVGSKVNTTSIKLYLFLETGHTRDTWDSGVLWYRYIEMKIVLIWQQDTSKIIDPWTGTPIYGTVEGLQDRSRVALVHDWHEWISTCIALESCSTPGTYVTLR